MAGMKRSNLAEETSATANSVKRRKVHHKLLHKQQNEAGPEPVQDRAFYGAQLIRSISLALVSVGFDSVKPSALESFRAEVEEYMLHFLAIVRTSMLASRRSQPIPQDFLYALSELGIEEHSLVEQLKTGVPPSVSQLPIGPPPPDEESPRDLEDMMTSKVVEQGNQGTRRWIPDGFPSFPGENTWMSTPVFTTRETDPRQIREKATEEGMLAEQALRDLMAAAKGSEQQKLASTKKRNRGHELWDTALGTMLNQDEDLSRKQAPISFDFDFSGGPPEPKVEERISKEPQSEGPLLVNYDRRYWRNVSGAAF